jgi:hypothetical protein
MYKKKNHNRINRNEKMTGIVGPGTSARRSDTPLLIKHIPTLLNLKS